MSRSNRWLKLFTEATAIILSILSAFAIDAWWEGRKDLAEEVELLRGLAAEFADNAILIEETLERSELGRADLQRLMGPDPEYIEGGLAEHSFAAVYEPLIRTWTVALTTGFLEATINSGKLALIRDLELRAALGRFQGRQTDVAEVVAYTNELNREAAKILGGYPEIRAVLASTRGFDGETVATLRISPGTVRAIRVDEELMSVASAKLRYWDGYFFEVEKLRSNVDEVLRLIDESQAR